MIIDTKFWFYEWCGILTQLFLERTFFFPTQVHSGPFESIWLTKLEHGVKVYSMPTRIYRLSIWLLSFGGKPHLPSRVFYGSTCVFHFLFFFEKHVCVPLHREIKVKGYFLLKKKVAYASERREGKTMLTEERHTCTWTSDISKDFY